MEYYIDKKDIVIPQMFLEAKLLLRVIDFED